MKRSTIILIVYLIISIITPIIVLKSCTGDNIKEQAEMWQGSICNSNTFVRYLLVPEGEVDSAKLDIYIHAVEEMTKPGCTIVNGEVHEKDSLFIAADSQGEVHITYEADDFALVIENQNLKATLHIDNAVIDDLVVSSRGDVYINESAIGVMLLTDSLGMGAVKINGAAIGTLMSTRDGVQQLFIQSSSIGRMSVPVDAVDYEVKDSNIGMMVNGGKRELLIGGSNAHMKIAVEVDSLDEAVEREVEVIETVIEEQE